MKSRTASGWMLQNVAASGFARPVSPPQRSARNTPLAIQRRTAWRSMSKIRLTSLAVQASRRNDRPRVVSRLVIAASER